MEDASPFGFVVFEGPPERPTRKPPFWGPLPFCPHAYLRVSRDGNTCKTPGWSGWFPFGVLFETIENEVPPPRHSHLSSHGGMEDKGMSALKVAAHQNSKSKRRVKCLQLIEKPSTVSAVWL